MLAIEGSNAYEALLALLDAEAADYQLLDHKPVGATAEVSALRGHVAAHAAKCLMLLVKTDRKSRRYVLAVVPGDRTVDLKAVSALYDARYVGFCDQQTAEQLAGAPSGAILPFPASADVELITDRAVLDQPRLYFNAARLDRSVSMSTADFARIARPRVEKIAAAVVGTPSMTPTYAINYEPLFSQLQLIDVQHLVDATSEPWYNQTLIELAGILVRLGVMRGQFHWHKHDDEDEFFLVLEGELRIELENAPTVKLGPWQAFCVPAGMLHRPLAPTRSVVVMVEKAGVTPTGDPG